MLTESRVMFLCRPEPFLKDVILQDHYRSPDKEREES